MMKYSAFWLSFLITHGVIAQKIRYEMAFPNAAHHEAEVSLTVSELPKGPATFRMSRSSPGRYATHEFGKNIYNVKAYDQTNRPVTINRVDGDVYEVPQHNGFVKVSYTLYGDRADGTYAGIDPQSIHLNMPATFLWVKGYDQQPIEVKFSLPKENKGKVATQLVPTSDPYTFTAPNFQYFMDSPTKIGDLHINEWKRKGADGKELTFRVALEANVTEATAQAFAQNVARVVDEAGAVYGEFPAYDYGSYTFIASINPYVKGDGMEHRNSTMISLPMTFSGPDEVPGVFAHEFFHCWNVERIRPKTLEPFNFEKSNMSDALWFAEGFTQYYGELLLARAGFTPADEYIGSLGGALYTKLGTPGATQYSPIDASCHAVFVDAGVSIDRTNYPNMFTSYYTYGAALAMALDLELRQNFGKSLDDYMLAVWKRFGKPENPYTVAGLQDELGRLTTKDFAATFFTRYIYGHEAIDYSALLTKAGLSVTNAAKGKAWMGTLRLNEAETGLTISANTIKGTPLYEAGLDVDDLITALDGKKLTKTQALTSWLESHKPGDVVPVSYQHRGENKTATLKLAENQLYRVVPFERAGLALTPAMQQFRAQWLGPKATR